MPWWSERIEELGQLGAGRTVWITTRDDLDVPYIHRYRVEGDCD